jgi:hypothetical protein
MDITTDVIFDVCFFYTGIKDGVAVYFDPSGYIEKPIRFIKKPRRIIFNGIEYPIPVHVREFLAWKYGPDWETPKTKKAAWQEEAPNLKKWKQ